MIDILDKNFAQLLAQLLKNCEDKGVIMIPYEKLRPPAIQASYWVQGRSFEEVQAKINELKLSDAPFLSKCLENTGMKQGEIVTNALPGCSWHQWGEAADCYWLKDGKACWDLDEKDSNNQNGYEVYASEAKKIGLEAGLYWENIVDAVHVQLQPLASPLQLYSIGEIDRLMEDYYA